MHVTKEFILDSFALYGAVVATLHAATVSTQTWQLLQRWYDQLLVLLEELLDKHTPKPPVLTDPYVFLFISASIEAKNLGEIPMNQIAKTCPADDTVTITVKAAHDVHGNDVAQLPNPLTWSVDNATLGSVAASADGLSAVFTPAGPLGVAVVTGSTNADGNSADTPLIVGVTATITITPGKAVAFDVDATVNETSLDQAAVNPPAPAPAPAAPVDTPAPAPVADAPAAAPVDAPAAAPAADAPAAAPAADTSAPVAAAPADAPAADTSAPVAAAPADAPAADGTQPAPAPAAVTSVDTTAATQAVAAADGSAPAAV